MTFSSTTAIAALLLFLPGCSKHEGRGAGTSLTGPSLAPNATRWSGTIELASASPSGSCEAEYAANHKSFAEGSATAELETDHDAARLTLQTASGQKCVFSGTAVDGAFSFASRHETCSGPPISDELTVGIARTCGAIDIGGDGPYWGTGYFTGTMTASRIDGRWTWAVWDPGGGGFHPTSFTIDVEVHVTAQ